MICYSDELNDSVPFEPDVTVQEIEKRERKRYKRKPENGVSAVYKWVCASHRHTLYRLLYLKERKATNLRALLPENCKIPGR